MINRHPFWVRAPLVAVDAILAVGLLVVLRLEARPTPGCPGAGVRIRAGRPAGLQLGHAGPERNDHGCRRDPRPRQESRQASRVIAHGAPIWEREAVLDLPVHGIDPEVRPGRYLPIASRLGPAEQANLGICAHGYVPGGVAPLIGQGAPSVDPDEALWERLRAR